MSVRFWLDEDARPRWLSSALWFAVKSPLVGAVLYCLSFPSFEAIRRLKRANRMVVVARR